MVVTKNVLLGRFGADQYLRISKHVINTMLANTDIFKWTRCDNWVFLLIGVDNTKLFGLIKGLLIIHWQFHTYAMYFGHFHPPLSSLILFPAEPFLYPNNSLSCFPVFWLLVYFCDSLNFITVAKNIGGGYLLALRELNHVYTWEHHHAYIIEKYASPKTLTANTSSEKGRVSRTNLSSIPDESCASTGKYSCCRSWVKPHHAQTAALYSTFPASVSPILSDSSSVMLSEF